ncbi:protein Mpv17-like isoform X2 [Chenopodium quinoa]|uniref:protein Mpv17-like isoform X2 n=1 Tax=Chenopodium quinoa TaxID=63459 RepID=UPI000B777AB4|nr:protein Mpv17-like isoform X2 [Chenopodium quinoa]XP_021729670.1 protein Mpv17-like isoform X2 [Chenopodium quinoa]
MSGLRPGREDREGRTSGVPVPIVSQYLLISYNSTMLNFLYFTIALQSSESYDLIRTLRMAGYGGVILGPTLHYWFNFMSRILPGTGLLTTVKKMALGQTVYGPTMTVTFFSMNAALQGEDAMEIFARLKRDLLPTMLNGVMYWPICDFITFRFVPVHLQPLASNSFSYLWTIYMTYMASLEKPSVA